ncbi:hypothetical protein NQZ68_021662 [Dissostichus eleginoides]|nr:hypothetical protein NQZ68_021662 [Dissostichus eleginoides]
MGNQMATTHSSVVRLFSTLLIHITSLKYSKPSETDGSRLLLVCDVALGQCTDVHKKDLTLTKAPEGYDSVHWFCRTPNTHSEFVFYSVLFHDLETLAQQPLQTVSMCG